MKIFFEHLVQRYLSHHYCILFTNQSFILLNRKTITPNGFQRTMIVVNKIAFNIVSHTAQLQTLFQSHDHTSRGIGIGSHTVVSQNGGA